MIGVNNQEEQQLLPSKGLKKWQTSLYVKSRIQEGNNLFTHGTITPLSLWLKKMTNPPNARQRTRAQITPRHAPVNIDPLTNTPEEEDYTWDNSPAQYMLLQNTNQQIPTTHPTDEERTLVSTNYSLTDLPSSDDEVFFHTNSKSKSMRLKCVNAFRK